MNIFALPDEEILPSERVLNAASFGQLEELTKALTAGGDPNYVRLGIAPSLITTMRDYTECLSALMEHGAAADLPNRQGWTALHEAARKEDGEALKIILSYPEQTNFAIRDNDGLTALRSAMSADRFDNANALMKASPDLIGQSDLNSITPIVWAVMEKKAPWLEWCLKNGADVRRENERGQSALSLAQEWDEGAALIESLSSFVVDKTAPVQTPVAAKVVEEIVEETAPANPFGLGGLKKKTL